jgi:hypothetical protein
VANRGQRRLTDEERASRERLLEQLKPETTWWSRLLGWFARRKRERAEKKVAAERKLAHERAMEVPVMKGVVVGRTTFINNGEGIEDWSTNTHRWDLYETPSGKRSVKFTRTHASYGTSDYKLGEDHPRYAAIILPWRQSLIDVDYKETLRQGDVRYRVRA